MIPFIETLLQKQIASLEMVNLSCRFFPSFLFISFLYKWIIVVDNQLDDHFSQSLLNVFMNANGDCSIKSIIFDGNPFSEEVLEHMRCVYGGNQ